MSKKVIAALAGVTVVTVAVLIAKNIIEIELIKADEENNFET